MFFVIGHFMGRETTLPGLSKQGKETVLEFKCTAHYIGGYFALNHLLHTLPCHNALFTALTLGS